MAQFIGKLLGKYNLGISDSWYALRIDKMIGDNKLIIVENKDPSRPYGKTLVNNVMVEMKSSKNVIELLGLQKYTLSPRGVIYTYDIFIVISRHCDYHDGLQGTHNLNVITCQ